VDEFQIDAGLYEALRDIRDELRLLFEQLRLRHETGDIPGKDRLERVPAFAKHNFANLRRSNAHLAAKQAWRLIDFLEGTDEARLSRRAREALRVVELDKKLGAMRDSGAWKDAARQLRSALGAELGDGESVGGADGPLPTVPPRSVAPAPDAFPAHADDTAPQVEPRVPVPAYRLTTGALFAGALAVVLTLIAGAFVWLDKRGESPLRCIALENASAKELAPHWSTPTARPLPRPPRTEAGQKTYVISDPAAGAPVNSTWTTSQFSFAEKTGPQRPGGGKSDLRLRVGGWGDTYLSLLRVPVPSDRLAHKAVLQLTVLGDTPDSRPTSMTLRAIGDDWRVKPGSENRLWWKDCPTSDAIRRHLPPPGPRGSIYAIDITDLYNMWAGGLRQPYGIILEPERIGKWADGAPKYSNFSTFYSTRARDPQNRPRLVLTY
jgi:hypothetical protein